MGQVGSRIPGGAEAASPGSAQHGPLEEHPERRPVRAHVGAVQEVTVAYIRLKVVIRVRVRVRVRVTIRVRN